MALSPFSPSTDFFAPFFSGFPSMMEGGALSDMSRPSGALSARRMLMDVAEKEDKFVVTADLPGVAKSDIKVTVDGDVLRVSVDKQERKEEDTVGEGGVKWHRVERSSAYSSRAMRMPDNAALDSVKASYKDGVLTLDVAKKDPAQSTRAITVE